MAAPDHLLYTPEQAARSTLAAVRYQSTLARIVSTDFSSEFVQGRGSSVTVKRPVLIDPAKVYTAENRRNEDRIQYSNLYQPFTSVSISDQVYNAVKLPDDFTTFNLTSLETEVIAPMATSVTDHLNSVVADAFRGISAGLTAADTAPRGALVDNEGNAYTGETALADLRASGNELAAFGVGNEGAAQAVAAADLTATYQPDVFPAIRAAHQLLSLRGIPVGGRYLVVGANWEAALLDSENLRDVSKSGDDGVLRDARLGRIHSFEVIVDYTLEPSAAYAFQGDGVVLVTRTSAIPRGASFASTIAQDGFTLRYLQDYDPDILTDRAVIDTFAGARVLDPQRVVRLTGAATMTDPAPADVEPAA